MKKIVFLVALLTIPFLMNAQKSPVDELYEKYHGKEGFTTVLVTKDMFEVVAKMEISSGDLEDKEILSKITRVRVIAQEDSSQVVGNVNFMDELKGVKFNDYKELVVVKEADQEVLVLAKEDNGKLTELLVLVGGKENVLVSVEGRFTMEDLEALGDLEGMDALGEILD